MSNISSLDFEIVIWGKDLDKEFEGQSERGIAIVGASFLDGLLQALFEVFLLVDEKVTPTLFDPFNSLSTFSSKIKLAYCLGLISKHEHDYLNTVRKIRNIFAHNLGDITFERSPIRDHCVNLKIPDKWYLPSMIPMYTDEVDNLEESSQHLTWTLRRRCTKKL